MKFFLPLLILPFLLLSCANSLSVEDMAQKTITNFQQQKLIPKEDPKHAEIMQEFGKLIHPVKGVQVTPYTHISLDSDMVFAAEEAPFLCNDSTIYDFGAYDGSGEPIRMTASEYFGTFIYDHDYANAEVIRWNQVVDRGGIIDNARDIYPDGQVVEYYFSGFDPQYGGMDWSALRLVFEQYKGSWYLVAIIHDQWTI